MFGFGMVRCKKRWCRKQFTRSYRGFINSEILGWHHERLGVSWCRDHNPLNTPMKGTIVPISRKRRGARKHRINVTKDALLDRFAGALERDDIQIPGQGAWRDEPLWGYQKINKQLGQRFEYKDISTEEAVEGMNRIFDYVPTVEEIDNGFDMSKWLAEEMKTAMDRAWNEQVIIPLFGSPDPVEPQGVASVYGPLTNHQQDVVDFIKDELTKEFAWVCTFCAKGDHAMLVGHPKCECCPTHYKSIHDL